ncbi:MAG: hydantoinase/oxoprolinase family protein [Blastocatellia bacterium]|nr:hydantoinase/oxoprolinase family protein [Blastocatellia bacterium]
MVILGVDTGGTFTDFVCFDGEVLKIHKVPSTPTDPHKAVVEGIEDLKISSGLLLHYGTTVATNAFLERKGAKVLLLTTAGFEDVLVIARQNRPDLYTLSIKRPEPFISHDLRVGVHERIGAEGQIVTKLTVDEIERVKETVRSLQPEAIAVVFLFSFLNPEHEKQIGEAVREAFKIPTFLSSELFPQYREYERTVVTGLNAYLSPIMEKHLKRLSENVVTSLPIRVMASSGGTITTAQAIRRPIETLLSGPAAGVVAATYLGRLTGFQKLITFDMGGTSTDVSLVDINPTVTSEAEFGGLPVRIPIIDIRTIGAGGGSIAKIDSGGALKVGPESSGAIPGPICYNRGGKTLTVTDANLFLGRIHPNHFLGGRMALDKEHVDKEIECVALSVGIPAEDLAEGIIEVANSNMERVLRSITVERGHDPADYTLVAFGGAGGLHAAELAERLSVGKVLVPRNAGAFCALGAVLTDMTRTLTKSLLLTQDFFTAPTIEEILEQEFSILRKDAVKELESDGVNTSTILLEKYAFLRYKGQSYELQVAYNNSVTELFNDFDSLHERFYSFSRPNFSHEIVAIFLRLIVPINKPSFPTIEVDSSSSEKAKLGETNIFYRSSLCKAALYDWSSLKAGAEIAGAAIVFEATSTVFVPPSWIAKVDSYANLILNAALS